MDWKPIFTAPYDRDLQLAVVDRVGVHALLFPCRRTRDGWINAKTRRPIVIELTHWREWITGAQIEV